MRVVFDTNIFVSAFAISGQQARKAIDRVTAGGDRLLISKPIIDEVLNVLTRKFEHDADGVVRTALLLGEMGEILATKQLLRLLKDDPDNRILECAVAGAADLGLAAASRTPDGYRCADGVGGGAAGCG